MKNPAPASALLAFFLAALQPCAFTQQTNGTTAAEPSATQKWLTQVSAQFQDVYEKTVLAPYKEGLETARKGYQTAIASALQTASGAGQLREAELLRQERERFFTAGRMVPTEPSESPLVQEARAKFKTQVAALDKAKFEKARSLHAKFDAALAQNISLLKQRQLLADAVLLAGKREEIAREWLPPAATAGSADAKEKKSAPLTHMGLKESIPWLLEKGAKLRYKSAKKQVLLKDPQPLRSGHVEFSSVSLVSCAAENNGPEIQDRDFDRLAPLRGTRSLVISGFKIGDSAFTFLEAWKEMEDFTLIGALVTDKLASRLAKFPMLREVSVARCEKVTGDFVHQLAATLPKLEALHLNDVDLGDQSVDDLLSFKRLTSLKLRGTRITDQGLARLAALKTLKDLDVGNTKVTLGACRA
jgi:hypothetical protein